MTDKEKILNWMLQGKKINKFTAWRELGTLLLAQRIMNIRDDIRSGKLKGYTLMREPDKNHNGAMVYWLEKQQYHLAI